MKALILAAGFGTRLKPYTDHIPKPLFEVNKRPVLDITINRLISSGCTGIIINTHHLHEQIESFIRDQHYTIPVTTRYEPEILDTGGAIRNVSDFWDDDPFLVVNSDIITDINYADVYRHHLTHNHPATLVLHDYAEFNNVSVDEQDMIRGFHLGECQLKKLAFTGIQVINPEVLTQIPAHRFTSSIALYKKLISDKSGVAAFIAQNAYWADIGSPEKFSRTCLEMAVPEIFGSDTAERTKLKGDGSDRKWYRLNHSGKSVILGDHGISCIANKKHEVNSFISIGNHLDSKGVAVPKILYSEPFAGHVYVEDLGDTDLEQVINTGKKSEDHILRHYRKVLNELVRFSTRGIDDFDLNWTCQTECYDKDLIIKNECNYFINAFVNPFTDLSVDPESLKDEFNFIAEKGLEFQFEGLMHRDCQSKNIMVRNDRHYFIDFQGARKGPVQYDLASLLIDPYVELSETVQAALYQHFIEMLSSVKAVNRENFLKSYTYLKITRNLQMLGAFGFLSRVKGKTWFENYIPAAVKTLKKNIKMTDITRLKKLNEIINTL